MDRDLDLMTSTAEHVARKRPSWLVAGLACLTIGMGAVVVGEPWTWMTDGLWPWSGSFSYNSDAGPTEAYITHPDGRTETFHAESLAEAHAWMDRRNEELKESYGINTKIAVGRVLSPVGAGLFATGGGILVWRSGRYLRRRLRGDGATTTA
jgi:hypothetical protein